MLQRWILDSNPRHTVWIFLAVFVGLATEPARADAGSCDGFADYADELVPSNFAIESQTPVGEGLSQVVLSFDLSNGDVGDFLSATAFPESGEMAAALGIEDSVAAGFGAVAPNAQASSATSLEIRLPSANVGTLLAELASGGLPLTVHAEERPILVPGARLTSWSASEDAYYALARDIVGPPVNPDPGPPPYAPGAEFTISLLAQFDGAGSVFDGFTATDDLWLVVGEHVPTEVPQAMHYARVLEVVKSDEAGADANDGITLWTVRLARTDTESLPAIYRSASFCTGSSAHIDLPVEATRIHTIDGDDQEAEERDGRPQPIHFNDTELDGVVSLSGQIEGHALRPSLEIRLRDGKVRAVIDIDTDLSLTVAVRALAQADFQEEELLSLFDLCFPLPDLVAGPVPIGMNLQLEHVLGAEGSIAAGAVVGLQKSFRGGFTVGYDARRPPGDRYFSRPRHEQPTPVSFTPPQLLDETGAHFAMSTEIRTALVVGAKYPFCSTGAGGFLGARASGSIDLFPTQDPWWRVGHDVELFAGIDLQILGLGIASHETGVEPFAGEETLEAGGPLPLGAREAADARAARGPVSSEFLSGEDQRWGVAIDGVDVPNGIEHTAVARLSDGGVAFVSQENIAGRNLLLRLDPYGSLQWSVNYRDVHAPRRVIALPDDTILVAGDPAWAALHDADGTLLSSWDFTVTDVPEGPLFCVVRSIVPVDATPAFSGFVAVGHHGRSDVRERDACAFRIDASGNLLWARTYGDAGAQEFYDVIVAADGSVVAVGETQTGPTLLSENNPLFALLDASDGSVVWARSLPTLARNARLNAVAEAPDGTLFGAGGGLRPAGDTGAALVARIDPDGANAEHALIAQDDVWEGLIPAAAFVDGGGGDTAFDEIFELIPVSGGFLFAGSTGLGATSEGWVGKINPRFGVEWFRSFDGDDADALDGLALAEDGYFASGFSRSLHRNLPGDDTQSWLMKLAFDGSTDLVPESGLRSRYIAPAVRASSRDPAVVPDDVVSMLAPLEETDALATSTVLATPDLLTAVAELCVTRLSGTGRESLTDACQPVPEPGAGLVVAIGVLTVLASRRRQRSS